MERRTPRAQYAAQLRIARTVQRQLQNNPLFSGSSRRIQSYEIDFDCDAIRVSAVTMDGGTAEIRLDEPLWWLPLRTGRASAIADGFARELQLRLEGGAGD